MRNQAMLSTLHLFYGQAGWTPKWLRARSLYGHGGPLDSAVGSRLSGLMPVDIIRTDVHSLEVQRRMSTSRDLSPDFHATLQMARASASPRSETVERARRRARLPISAHYCLSEKPHTNRGQVEPDHLVRACLSATHTKVAHHTAWSHTWEHETE